MALEDFRAAAAANTADEFGESSYSSPTQKLEALFRLHYTGLCRFSLSFVKQPEQAEEIVQDTFVAFWEKSTTQMAPAAAKAYLYTTVRNRSLNYLNSQHARQQFQREESVEGRKFSNTTGEQLDFDELSRLVETAMSRLPPQCRTIFEMSRLGGLSYQEIAEALSLSPKTVENQLGIALRKMKEYLCHYWDLLQVLFITLSAQEWILFHI